MKLEQTTPAERDLPRLPARKAHLVGELRSWSSDNRRRRQRRILILVPAVLGLLAATGFTTYALVHEPVYESVGCFERAAVNAKVSVVDADGRDPVEICREVFRTSGMRELAISGEFEACVLDTGAMAFSPAPAARRAPSSISPPCRPPIRTRPRSSACCGKRSQHGSASLPQALRSADRSAWAKRRPS